MKVGSLVKCITAQNEFKEMRSGEIAPIKDSIYTVRYIETKDTGSPGIRLEELVNPPKQYLINGRMCLYECTFAAKNFVELQPPMEVGELFSDFLKISC